MLSLPVYRRGGVFYFHARVNGTQVKRSLRTGDPLLAKLRAVQLLGVLNMHKPKLSDFDFGSSVLKRYEIDLASGKLRADGPEDHALMMQALEKLTAAITPPTPSKGAPLVETPVSVSAIPTASRLTLSELAQKFFSLKSSLSEGTRTDYLATAREFDAFTTLTILPKITDQTVTKFMEHLAGKGNTPRTIDKKVGAVRALFNFAIKQKIFTGSNPAADRNLLSKKEKRQGGSNPFELSDLQALFACPQFKQCKTQNPDFYWIVVTGMLTGIRVTALSAITNLSLKVTPKGTHYIYVEQDKTAAGRRSVPIPEPVFTGLKAFLDEKKGFIYENRADGKGASDPVRKELDKHKKLVKFEGSKLTFHSFRKTLNTFLMHEKVPFEVRCQFIGHEFDHVNKQVYGEQFSTDEVAEWIIPAQKKLLELLQFDA
jgi:integrase